MHPSIIPVSLWPAPPLGLGRRWQLLDGVTLQPLTERMRSQLEVFYKTLPVAVSAGHDHAVFVQRELYIHGLRARYPNSNASADWLIAHDLAKLFVLAAFLTCPTGFKVGAELSGDYSPDGRSLKISSFGNVPQEAGNYYRQCQGMQDLWPRRSARSQIKQCMLALEPYFRADEIRVDRIGAALAHLWSSLCTPYSEQALLSICAGLEALTSTGDKTEVTHQLSERLALLLERPGEKRHELFAEAKKIYGMRSSVIHGTYLRRGSKHKVWPDRLIISPKLRVFDNAYLIKGTRLLVRAIRAFLGSAELRQICALKDDRNALRVYFELQLLGKNPSSTEPTAA